MNRSEPNFFLFCVRGSGFRVSLKVYVELRARYSICKRSWCGAIWA